MKCLRAQLARVVPAVVALFTLSIAAPQAGLFYHQHAGGVGVRVLAEQGDDPFVVRVDVRVRAHR